MKQYTFSCHPNPGLFSGQSDGIEYTINEEKTRDEILESFRNFLIASGYQFKLTETIQVVDEDWHEPSLSLDESKLQSEFQIEFEKWLDDDQR